MANDTERTPAEELRAAAETLRGFARLAHKPPWRPDPDELGRGIDIRAGRNHMVAFGMAWDDAAWATLVHPGLAEPLAEWLEYETKRVERLTHPRNQEIVAGRYALAMARHINGGTDA